MKAPLKESVEQIVDLILRDFIKSWFDPMNFSASEDFPKYIRMTILTAFQKISVALEAGNPTSVLVPIFQTLILHIVSLWSSLGFILIFVERISSV